MLEFFRFYLTRDFLYEPIISVNGPLLKVVHTLRNWIFHEYDVNDKK